MIVKCIDRLHNMLTLYGDVEKMKKKIKQTKDFVFSIAEDIDFFLIDELKLAVEEQVIKLNRKGIYLD